MFGYSFVTLTKEEAIHRRELLDLYATIAQFSPIVPILCIHIYRGARWGFRTIFRPSYFRPAGSYTQDEKTWLPSIRLKLGRLHLWLDKRTAIGFTRGECAFSIIWTAWLLLLSVHRTGDGMCSLKKPSKEISHAKKTFCLKTSYILPGDSGSSEWPNSHSNTY